MILQPDTPDESSNADSAARKLTSHETKALVIGLLTLGCEIGALVAVSSHKYATFSVLFPFAFMLSLPTGGYHVMAAVLMLAQFPLYGYLVGRAWIRSHLRKTFVILAAIHITAAILGFGLFLLR